MAQTYKEGTWHGRPLYTCLVCGARYHTTDFERLTAHLAGHSAIPIGPPKPKTKTPEKEGDA